MQLFQINQSARSSKITINAHTTIGQLHQRPITTASTLLIYPCQTYTIRRDTFRSYCEDLQRGNARARSSYLAVASLQQTFPQLLAEVPLPAHLRTVHCTLYCTLYRCRCPRTCGTTASSTSAPTSGSRSGATTSSATSTPTITSSS